MNFLDTHLLSIVVFLPLVGALVSAFLPRGEGGQHKGIAFVTTLATFLVSIGLWVGFKAPVAGKYAFDERVEWAPALGFSYHIGLDGVALLLVMLTTFLGPIVVLSAWKFAQTRVKEFCLALLVLQTAMLGTLASLDLVLFYVFWEAMLIPMYLLIGVWGSEKRIYAAVKFFLFTFIGSVLMLLAIFYVWSQSGNGGSRTFDYPTLLASASFTPEVQMWLFAAFALAFAIKVPMFPLHTWLPDAHTEAPAVGSVLLAGVMLKLGTFGFIRYAMPLFPHAAHEYAIVIATLGVIGIVYGSLMCMAQTDLKRLIAYSSVAHLGFVMLGLAALTPEAVSGAVMQMVNHGISTGALFLMIGYLYERTHTRKLADYGGLAAITPGIAAVFLVITLSSIGLPGTNGFVGEFLVLMGTYTAKLGQGSLFGLDFDKAAVLSAFAATGVILGAVYMLWMYQRTMFGPVTREENKSLKDLSLREWITFAPLLAAIVVIGVQPQSMLSAIKQPVDEFVARVNRADASVAPRTATGATPARRAPLRPRAGVQGDEPLPVQQLDRDPDSPILPPSVHR
ncbi:MAG: NADH-quinone oxidoreductase subunit M [Deltaproteobacteria bacterium]|nr:NADH-quinone oxidoreductase subunit M [Deltaproteobacteria bacterium]